MIIFWRNSTGITPSLLDKTISYSIGFVFILIFIASVVLNIVSFTVQCFKKATVYRRLFKLLAITDLLTSLIYPCYAAYMALKPELLPTIARIGEFEAMLLKLGSIPIYLSVVLTSLLSISRYICVRDPLSVQRTSLLRDTSLIFLLVGLYLVANLGFLLFSVSENKGKMYRGAGLTVYSWDVTLLAEASSFEHDIPDPRQHVRKLTLISIIMWLPAQLHCLGGFITSVMTIFILNSSKNISLLSEKSNSKDARRNRRRFKVNQTKQNWTWNNIGPVSQMSPQKVSKASSTPSNQSYQMETLAQKSPTLQNKDNGKSRMSPRLTTSTSIVLNREMPSLNNRRGAVTILFMNIGNVMWFLNFIVVIVIEFKRDECGFVFLDSARFLGRLFVPQVFALLNPSIVILRSTDLRDSFANLKRRWWSRTKRLVTQHNHNLTANESGKYSQRPSNGVTTSGIHR